MKEQLSYQEVEAATEGFALEMFLGKGSCGRVYKGILSSGLLVGVSRGEREKLIVMEYMPNGSLHDHASLVPPPWPQQQLLIALHIVQAVRALHEATPPIVHRDIKSSNILFDSSWSAKLADFSLAVQQADAFASAASPAGTIEYLDPSYTGPGRLSPKNDIFSYGVVLLELISGRQVMDAAYETTSRSLHGQRATTGLRPGSRDLRPEVSIIMHNEENHPPPAEDGRPLHIAGVRKAAVSLGDRRATASHHRTPPALHLGSPEGQLLHNEDNEPKTDHA